MGQAAKYAVLGAAIISVLGTIAILVASFLDPSTISGVNNVLNGAISFLSNSLLNMKGLINYFLGSSALISAFNTLLWLNLLYPVVKIAVKVVIAVVRWMNQ